MPYLQVENLTKSVGDRLLFSDVTFGVNEGDKIGIVAKNGTGKTSLLRIIAGTDTPDSGTVVCQSGITVAILEQVPYFDEGATVIEACLSAKTPMARLVAQYERAIANGDDEATSKLIPEMDAMHAWDYEDRARQMLTQCRITNLDAKVSTLSGGQKKRIAICRLLIDNPDLLVLDEPTNHLDIATVEWLETFLSRSRTTLLMVTHDRYFLDNVCNKIIEIDNQSIYTYEGNYDYYLRRRAERIEAMSAELARVKNTLRKEQEWMRRQPQARAGKAKYRIDAFYDLKAKSMVNLNERNVNLDVKSTYIGNKIFEAHNVSKKYGEKIVLDDFSYIFSRYEKLGIVGINGVGKSTFIKMLQGIVAPDSGFFDVGETVKFGYYSQDGIQLDPNKKVIDAITEIAEDVVVNGNVHYSPMQFLNKFLFSPADQQKYISTLSGGERARLHLAEVLMRSPNFLILDEPTNDLDIITLGLLEEYLRDFSGCLIVISHDRFFLDSTVDHLFVFQGDGIIKDFPGTYSEYRKYLQSVKSASESTNKKVTSTDQLSSREKGRTERKRKLTFKEKRELETLILELDKLNEEKSDIEKVFSGEKSGNIAECSLRYEELKSLIDEKELRWLELSELED